MRPSWREGGGGWWGRPDDKHPSKAEITGMGGELKCREFFKIPVLSATQKECPGVPPRGGGWVAGGRGFKLKKASAQHELDDSPRLLWGLDREQFEI